MRVLASGADCWVLARYAANGVANVIFGRITVTGGYLEGLQVEDSNRILAVGSRLDGSNDDEPVLTEHDPEDRHGETSKLTEQELDDLVLFLFSL